MSNSTQDVGTTLPADVVRTWMKGDQVGVYCSTVLATMVTYDAGEYLIMSVPK